MILRSGVILSGDGFVRKMGRLFKIDIEGRVYKCKHCQIEFTEYKDRPTVWFLLLAHHSSFDIFCVFTSIMAVFCRSRPFHIRPALENSISSRNCKIMLRNSCHFITISFHIY